MTCYYRTMLRTVYKQFLKYTSFLVLALIVGLLFIRLAHAQDDFRYNVLVNYDVDVTGVTHVTERYTVTNDSSNRYLQSIQISTPSDDVQNLEASYGDGTSLHTTTQKKTAQSKGYNYDYQQIVVDFNRRNTGLGNQWTFEVHYDTTKLVDSKGGGHTVYIPSIAADSSDKYNIQVLIPDSFGSLQSSDVKPVATPAPNDKTLYVFPREELNNQPVTMVFGDKTIYQVNFGFPLKNETGLPRTFTVTLPPNTPTQSVYINSLNPQPTTTSLDSDGNILADYEVPPRTSINVQTDILAEVRYKKYDLAASGTKADIPQDLVRSYTSSTQYWQSDNPNIKRKARELTQGKTSVAEQVKAINNYVIETLTYNNDKIKYNVRQGGVKALTNPSNVVCLEYSDLSISLLRAAGIPARMPVGYGYSGDLKPSSSVSDSLHSWVEVYVPNVGWINVDPTWGEKFSNFGVSDLDHLTFAIWGARDSNPAAISVGNTDLNYQYENSTLNYVQKIPPIPDNSKLAVQQLVLLPFVSIGWADITAPQSQATNDASLQVVSKTVKQLKPLAPGQKAASFFLVLGKEFVNTQNYSLVSKTTGGTITLARTNSVTQWWLLIVVFLSGVMLVAVVKSRVSRNRIKSLESEVDELEMMEIKEHINDKPKRKK